MNYFKKMYGTRSPDFIKGVLAGIEAFAWWKDGTQYVGTYGTTMTEAMQEAIDAMAEVKEDWDIEYPFNPYQRRK